MTSCTANKLLARLEALRVERNGCWEIDIDRGKKYPQLTVNGRKVTSHRLAFSLYVGDIPPGKHVLHRCDNPRCHNPAHLFLGTHSDNMTDMCIKKRHSMPKPRINPELLALVHAGRSQKEIAAIFGVSQTAVSYALRKLGVSRGRTTNFRKHAVQAV